MPFFAAPHIDHALTYLRDSAHPSLISLLAMLRTRVPVMGAAGAAAVEFGGPEEHALLGEYFRPVGGTEDRPFFVPFGPPRSGDPRWKKSTYGGTSLQRMRADRPSLYIQGDGGESGRTTFMLAADFRDALANIPKARVGALPLSIHNLAAWMYREIEFPDQAGAIAHFADEFRLADYGLLGGIFTDVPDPTLAALPLEPARISDAQLLTLLGGLYAAAAPPQAAVDGIGVAGEVPAPALVEEDEAEASPVAAGTWDVSLEAIRAAVADLKGVEEAALRAVAALRAGMHVVFTGPPGCGKTQLAQRLCLASGFAWATATATDAWTTFETIGGYFPLPGPGGVERLDFMPGAIVEAMQHGRILLIDEINRADIDKAFGEMFTLLSGHDVDLPFRRQQGTGEAPAGRRIRLAVRDGDPGPGFEVVRAPSWWRLIGAMNDSDKASLKRLSFAFMRRFAFVPVELPAWGEYSALLDDAAGKGEGALAAKAPALVAVVKALFASEGGLATIGVPMGAAIPHAILRHAASELGTDPSRTQAQMLASALDLYVAPQLQGRADLHEKFVGLVAKLTAAETAKDAALSAKQTRELNAKLAVWTGYVVE